MFFLPEAEASSNHLRTDFLSAEDDEDKHHPAQNNGECSSRSTTSLSSNDSVNGRIESDSSDDDERKGNNNNNKEEGGSSSTNSHSSTGNSNKSNDGQTGLRLRRRRRSDVVKAAKGPTQVEREAERLAPAATSPWKYRNAAMCYVMAKDAISSWYHGPEFAPKAWKFLEVLGRFMLQIARLVVFFSRLAVYVVVLALPFAWMYLYWMFGAKNVVSVKFKDGGGFRHTCDLYLPNSSKKVEKQSKKGTDTDGGAPVILLITGGAWAIGYKCYTTLLCRALREAGFLCIAVDYRYWPQVGVNGMVEDNDIAVGWALKNISSYGGDPKRLIVLGHSSGGHVGSLMLARRAFGRPSDLPLPTGESTKDDWTCADIFGFIGLAGVYHLNDHFLGHLHSKGFDRAFVRTVFGGTQALRDLLSPLSMMAENPSISTAFPPTLLVHCTGDKIVPLEQSENFRDMIVANGGDAELCVHEGGGHNDPVIHAPFMSDDSIVRNVILAAWRWGDQASKRKAEASAKDDNGDGEDAARTETTTSASSSQSGSEVDWRTWERVAEEACKESLGALPTWPKMPRTIIETARSITPF